MNEHGGRTVTIAGSVARMRSDLPLAVLDAILIAGSYVAVLLLRFDGAVPPDYWRPFQNFLPVAVLVHLAANWAWGLYGQMWRHASVQEARRVLLAGATTGLCTLLLYVVPGRRVPDSAVVLGVIIATMWVGCLRFQSRLFAFRRSTAGEQVRVVVIGAGESGASVVREMLRSPDGRFWPVAILDDDPRKHGRRLSGVPIVGGLDALPQAAITYRVQQALLAIPSATGAQVRQVAATADAVGLSLKVLPGVAELLGGEASVRDVRDMEITDLLGRQQVATDLDAVRSILTGRRVLITGAGGSIGSEIARQVAACEPADLLMLDHDETHLHDVAMTVPEPYRQLLADIRDPVVVDAIFATHRPEVVFHAAAHKHVPLLEGHPCEAAATNVLATAHVARAAARHGVERFVFISTDKAVRPGGVMGATKRIGEHIVRLEAPAGARFCSVRFGNVLGSRGSVIPTFMRQIQQGGPVTVTDPRMVRFFMSIPEAVQLVLQSAAISDGGEVFMLDMGEPVRIVDLAERMIRLTGRRVGADVAIRFTGSRPGEKLAEELRFPEEVPHETAHPAIVRLHPASPEPTILAARLKQLSALVAARNDQEVTDELFALANDKTVSAFELPEPAYTIDLTQTEIDLTEEEEAIWHPSST